MSAVGRLFEDGSHEELVSRAGRYAELFGLQAAGYRRHLFGRNLHVAPSAV